MADDRPGAVTIPDARHVVFIARVVLDDRLCFRAGADADARPAVLVALVAADRRARAFADADARADVGVANIVDHQRAGVVVPDARVEVFPADIALDDGRRSFHRADAAAHVAIGEIADDVRRDAPSLGPDDCDAGVADVMHDVVGDRAALDANHRDAAGAGRADMLVRLLLALRGVVLFPKRLVVDADAGHGETVQRRVLGHQDARPLGAREIAVDDRRFRAPQPQLPGSVGASAADGDIGLQADALLVRAGADEHRVARLGCVDGRLN